jgi:hypothetical protein
LIETCACGHDNPRASVALDLQKQRQPFSCDFRIGQNIFNSCQLGFWEEERLLLPIEQAFIKHFLRMHARAEDPDCGMVRLSLINRAPVKVMRDYSRQKRLRRLNHVRKLDGPFGPAYRGEFARDWFARGGALQKLR